MLLSAVLKVLTSLVFLGSSSVVLYVTFRSTYLPRNVILREPLYFDFSKVEPTAKLTLLSEEKQWEYIDRAAKSSSAFKTNKNRRFLMPYATYIISVEIAVSKSQRNRNMSKFMLEMKTIGANNTELASSSRPVVIPYESTVSKVLGGLILFPFRILGIIKHSETAVVQINLMNNYVEPVEQTERLEFRVSTNEADIEEVTLSLFPRLNMVMYSMYYYPGLAFVTGVSVIAFFEMCICLFGLAVYYGFKLLTAEPGPDAGEREPSSDAGTSDDDIDSEVRTVCAHIIRHIQTHALDMPYSIYSDYMHT